MNFPTLRNFITELHGYAWWKIALEILVIGLVVYYLIRFLRGTRGAHMLRGIAVLLISLSVLVYLLVNTFQLDRLGFLYGKFLIFAGYAVIVAFQPELRRVLLRLGETRLFRGFSNELVEDIAELVDACVFLSRRKIGALIAIERETSLGSLTEDATKLNADLTAPLLDTIFWPNSPLHDMGVVIVQGRIMYAGVQFPLADAGELEKELGTRHRAAVGLSHEFDAVVLVVSEETGDISVAENGQLFRKLTAEGLRGLLAELLGGGDSGGKRKEPVMTAERTAA